DLDRRTPAQQRLDGLVGASKAALAAGTLPTTGGLRPQVMVTVGYRDLLNSIQTTTTRGPLYASKRNRASKENHADTRPTPAPWQATIRPPTGPGIWQTNNTEPTAGASPDTWQPSGATLLPGTWQTSELDPGTAPGTWQNAPGTRQPSGATLLPGTWQTSEPWPESDTSPDAPQTAEPDDPTDNQTTTNAGSIAPAGINWAGTDLFAKPLPGQPTNGPTGGPTGRPAGAATGSGTFTYSGPVTASTIREIACDADIIPVLLGSEGRILDIGRTTRIFPPHIRKALNARDQGCAFPNCTIPATWCEAHHITYWSRGGPTSTDNGVLLCTHHHALIHKEQWKIHVKNGIPWFIPPPHIDPRQQPRQNHHHKT
ncbi:DUF222 domain-containing protein, partial [Arthrobacter globiformis]|uniref:HNH endonuclease signature motif containing protein n=1 Tax=Arthrobacter globiformis TaxID=1665 RepID=UPI00397A7424